MGKIENKRMSKEDVLRKWTNKDAIDLYGIRYWGSEYFNVSEDGEVTVKLQNAYGSKEISIYKIVQGLVDRGFPLPVLLRFKDILNNRLNLIYKCFQDAINEYGYGNIYRGVYPIKVNQQEEVIKEIADSGKLHHHGFEAGSKAELIAALAYMHDPEAYIICNGYKDEDFIDLALYSLKLGLQTILVIERPNELEMIFQRSRIVGIKPKIGFRVKLSSRANGHWAESAGDSSVFGMTTSQIIKAITALKEQNLLDCLVLLHYHIGSQISDIKGIRIAIAEAARFYIEMAREGARMGMIDIGGGLAVDYDGSKTNFTGSRNYSVQEYCNDIIEAVIIAFRGTDIPHPVIVSESGRALVAYYSVLLFNILDVNKLESPEIPEPLAPGTHEYVANMLEIYKSLTVKNIQESFHDAIYYRDQVRSLFVHGTLSLRERGLAEDMFWFIIKEIFNLSSKLKYIPEELESLNEILRDTYYGNFSIFQSVPDSWAIDQLFPMMPIHRLNERPRIPAYITDVTCDCDGKITQFIDLHDIKKFIYLHDLNDEMYILGIFLVGAYQETLGDLHNLFGDTNVVSVSIDQNGNIVYLRELTGDSVSDVLSYVEYDPKELVNRFRHLAETAVQTQLITASERKKILSAYVQGLQSYTYLKND